METISTASPFLTLYPSITSKRSAAFSADRHTYSTDPSQGLSVFPPVLPAMQAHSGNKAYNSVKVCMRTLTWLLWMEMAHANFKGNCWRLRWIPDGPLKTHFSILMTCVTPQRNLTLGSPVGVRVGEKQECIHDAQELRSKLRFFSLLPHQSYMDFRPALKKKKNKI